MSSNRQSLNARLISSGKLVTKGRLCVLGRAGCAMALVAVVFSLVACGGHSTPTPTPNPAPVISTLSPNAVAAGTPGFTLAINGSNFLSSSQVQLNSVAKAATLVGASQLTIVVDATDIGATGALAVSVTNPAPGGGTASANLAVSAPAAPVIASVSPSTIPVGSTSATLDVTGSNFVRNSVIRWNGTDHTTTYLNNTHISAALSAAELSSAGYAQVTVFTAAPGGGTSNGQTVTVQHPLPSITTLNPAAIAVGSQGFVLDLSGASFASGALVYWNGISRVTSFVSSTELRANILTSDLLSAQVVRITVVNPGPSAGQAQPVFFEIRNPVPVVTIVTPDTVFAGSTQLTVAVSGSGFMQGSSIQIAGVPQSTTFVNSSTVNAINVSMAAKSQANDVLVVNPGPGGGTSNAVALTTVPSGPGVRSFDTGFAAHWWVGGMSTTSRYVWDDYSLADTCFGVSNCTQKSTMYGSHSGGTTLGAATDDGRYVALRYRDITFEDTCTNAPPGCVTSSIVVTRGTGEIFTFRDMSSNGRYVLYGGSNSTEYMADTCIQAAPGCAPAVLFTAASLGEDPYQMTPDARYVLSRTQVYDTCINGPSGCISTAFPVPAYNDRAVMSAEGRFVAFRVDSTNSFSIFVFDTCAGATGCTPSQTEVLRHSAAGSDWGFGGINRGGRYVTFVSDLPDLVPNDTNNAGDVFLLDTCLSASSPCTPSTLRVSVAETGEQYPGRSSGGAISQDGRIVLFGDSAGHVWLSQLP